MSNIDNSIQQLILAILESDSYKEYDIQRRRVNQNPELKRQIDEFRRRNFELQSNNSTLEKIDEFEREYEQFRQIPMVADFLAAELDFCRLMQDIFLKVTMAIHFE